MNLSQNEFTIVNFCILFVTDQLTWRAAKGSCAAPDKAQN